MPSRHVPVLAVGGSLVVLSTSVLPGFALIVPPGHRGYPAASEDALA